MFGNKRFRMNPVFDLEVNPVPDNLKNSLNIIGAHFNNSYIRSMEIMNTSEQRLFGLMTNYDSNNYCWIQPTRVKNYAAEADYDRYIVRVQREAKLGNLEPLPESEIQVGAICLARYEADHHWYRAMIVGEQFGRLEVIFIDYGNYQYCTSDQLKRPFQDPRCNYFQAPVQAVCCRLYNIIPKHPNCRAQIDAKLEDFFVKNANHFLEIVVKNSRIDFVVDCDIFISQRVTAEGQSAASRFYRRHIGQEVVDAGLATFADSEAAYAIAPPPVEVIKIDIDQDIKREVKQEVKDEFKTDVKPILLIDK